jgi:hypothetical protein
MPILWRKNELEVLRVDDIVRFVFQCITLKKPFEHLHRYVYEWGLLSAAELASSIRRTREPCSEETPMKNILHDQEKKFIQIIRTINTLVLEEIDRAEFPVLSLNRSLVEKNIDWWNVCVIANPNNWEGARNAINTANMRLNSRCMAHFETVCRVWRMFDPNTPPPPPRQPASLEWMFRDRYTGPTVAISAGASMLMYTFITPVGGVLFFTGMLCDVYRARRADEKVLNKFLNRSGGLWCPSCFLMLNSNEKGRCMSCNRHIS